MGLWDKKPDDPEAVQESQQPGGIEGMILNMVAKNPAMQKAFEGLQNLIQGYVEKQTAMDGKLDQIIAGQARLQAAFLNTLPGLPSGEARGVINDGVRCVSCGSDGDCHDDCPLGGTAASAGRDGSSGGGSGGSVGAHDGGNG